MGSAASLWCGFQFRLHLRERPNITPLLYRNGQRVMMGLFGTNGVRGVFGKEFTLEKAQRIAAAVAKHMGSGPVLVGRDGRESSAAISQAVCASLNYSGLDCADAGLVPTPCLEYCVRELGYAGGMMITASHNPPQYNGIKVVAGDGVEISRDRENTIESYYDSECQPHADAWGTTSIESRAVQTYVSGIVSQVSASSIMEKNYTVVLDMGNGAQCVAAPLLCSRLNCRLIPVNGTIHSMFPGRGAEPTPDNLKALSGMVIKTGAHMGMAFDGDGDRSMMCDDAGRILTGDASSLVLVRYLMGRNPDSVIVTCVNSGSVIEDIASGYGCRVIRTKVGSVEVSRMMVPQRALAGFEENGGFMYGPHNCVRDGLMTLALTLEMMATQDTTITKQTASLPETHTAKAKAECPPHLTHHVMDAVYQRHPESDCTDGIKVHFGPSHWVMMRPSGTEPIIRVYAEAPSEMQLHDTLERYTRIVRDAVASRTT